MKETKYQRALGVAVKKNPRRWHPAVLAAAKVCTVIPPERIEFELDMMHLAMRHITNKRHSRRWHPAVFSAAGAGAPIPRAKLPAELDALQDTLLSLGRALRAAS